MTSPLELTALELRELLLSGELRAEEVVRSYLDNLERWEGSVDAFNEIYPEESLASARAVDKRLQEGSTELLLPGLPLALKDNLCTASGHTTCSSAMLAGFQAPYDATAVARLRSAGAVILGKTNMDEFAMGSSTENSRFKVTRNPWNPNRVPGGSSGGSAAAVAARQCAAAVGSDTGGSVRQPASFCGVVGLKPTYGRISRYGLIAYGSSLDQIGPITKDVADCALLLQALAGYDPRDSTSADRPVPDYLASLQELPQKITIGLPKEFYTDALSDQVRRSIEEAIEVFRRWGANIKSVSLPTSRVDLDADGALSSYAVACYYIIAMAEASSNLSRYDGIHYGFRAEGETDELVQLYAKTRSGGFGEEVKRRIMLGTYVLSSGYYDAYYKKAQSVRRLIRTDYEEALRQCDVLLCPVSPSVAFEFGEKSSDPLAMYLEDVFTLGPNLAGMPGLSLPCGLSEENLPIGMQLVGPVFSEEFLLRVGRLYERETDFYRLSPQALKT
jgi:aspartyl-tRNA(Asn)/glutamyl-tRNA(Gln) amidotransferase subunit A